MKILFCDNSLYGQLNFRGDVIKKYASQGYQVVLVSPSDREFNWDIANVKYVPITLHRTKKNPITEVCYFLRLLKIYIDERPDYIFHYSIKPNIYGTLAARLCHIPSTAAITGLGYMFSGNGLSAKFARTLYKFALSFSEYVLVLNRGNKQYLQDLGIVRTSRIVLLTGGEGVNLIKFKPLVGVKRDKTIFLMIARPLYDKGYSEYVTAARKIKERYENVEFNLLGQMDLVYPNHVPEDIVMNDHEEGVINYLGFLTNVIPIMEKASCVVLPSYHEGLSRSLMEAIAMGKPVITTDIPGCRETVEDGKNGYIVPPQNALALEDAFEKFINLSELECEEMEKYSRIKAEREFDIKYVIDVYRKITASVE